MLHRSMVKTSIGCDYAEFLALQEALCRKLCRMLDKSSAKACPQRFSMADSESTRKMLHRSMVETSIGFDFALFLVVILV